MFRKNKYLILAFGFWLLAISLSAFSQVSSLAPTLIGSTGGFGTATINSTTATISYSVGEPMVTTVTSPSVTLTQGFQQPTPTALFSVTVTATPSATICMGKSTTLNANSSSLALPLTYTWSPTTGLNNPNISNPIASPSITTTYTVNVKDAILNAGTATITITVNTPSVIISSTVTSAVCPGSSITLSTINSGVTSYTWAPTGQTTSSITVAPTTSTTYSVTVKNSTGCTATARDSITVTPTPTITVSGNTTICRGSSTTLSANSTATIYNWNPGNLTTAIISAQPTSSTNYTVTGTLNGCMGITTVSVTVNPAPTVSISGSVSICLGNHATLASSSGVNYSWSTVPVQTTQSISDNPSTTTTYSVTVANSFGCTATATHTVNVSSITPQITGGNTTICSGNTTTLTASGGTSYTWITSPSQTTASITVAPTTTTSYSVFVTNSIGCSGMATATVNVNSSLLSSISANSTTLCPGTNTSITISASGGTTYSWSTGQTTTSIIVSPLFPFGPHTYSVAISNGSCTADTSITITVLTPPNISISTTPSTPTICSGDAITLTGGGGTFYFWGAAYGSPPSIVVYPTVTSTYTVIGQNVNSNSCYNFASVNVTVNSITAIVGNNITICPGFTAQLSATAGGDTTGLSYNWYNSSDSLIHSSNNPYFSVNPNVTTFYLVSATNGLSCNSANDTVWVFVDANNNCAIHIYNGITPNGDGKNDTWYIDGIQSFPDNVVDIFNRWGEKVWEGAHYDNDKGSDHVIWKGHNQSGQPLPAGTYYYVIDINGKRFASGWVELTR